LCGKFGWLDWWPVSKRRSKMTNHQSIPDESESYVCSECGVDVSIDDEICPNCGADLSEIEEDEEEVKSTHKYRAASDFFLFEK